MSGVSNEKYQKILSSYKKVVSSVDKDLIQHLSKSWIIEQLTEDLKKDGITVSRRTIYRAFKSTRAHKKEIRLWNVPRL